MRSPALPEEAIFNRPSKYKVVKELGAGACGSTVLLYDAQVDCRFVAKKFIPIVQEEDDPNFFLELLDRFKQEARILFRLNHPYIVRVYNFFDYTDHKTSFILMEYVEGSEILDYLKAHPYSASTIFERLVEAFSHLEEANILHRDIRPGNILIDTSGNPRIIDFGFGKAFEEATAANLKSISLNWWCDTPSELDIGVYGTRTEIYFLGNLFRLRTH